MEFARTGHRRTGGDRRSDGRRPRSTVTTGLPREHGSVRTARSRNPVPTAGLRRVLPAVLLVATAVLLAGAGAATPPAGDTVAGTHGGNVTGTVEEITVNTTFVGTVADEGRVSVTAHGVTGDDGDPVSGERVTVTVGGDPVTTAAVENGSLETTFDPTVLDLDPGTDATVALHGFDAASTTTVGIVHEVLGLDAGYNRHSVPQAATVSVEGVAAVDVWNASAGRYEAVTDPVFDAPAELHRGLYVLAADGARLGYTFETAANPVPGVVSLEPGWNFVGSNYDIAGGTEQTVQADLVGVDAAAHDLFTADLAAPLEPGDAVGPFDSYWAFVEGTAVERGILPAAYDAAERAETLGVGTSEFAVVDTNATRRGTDDSTIAVTATIENRGERLGTQFVDLQVDTGETGGFDRVDRVGLELAPAGSGTVTLTHDRAVTGETRFRVVTGDDRQSGNVTIPPLTATVSHRVATGVAPGGPSAVRAVTGGWSPAVR